jgi:hypothetical protein
MSSTTTTATTTGFSSPHRGPCTIVRKLYAAPGHSLRRNSAERQACPGLTLAVGACLQNGSHAFFCQPTGGKGGQQEGGLDAI